MPAPGGGGGGGGGPCAISGTATANEHATRQTSDATGLNSLMTRLLDSGYLPAENFLGSIFVFSR